MAPLLDVGHVHLAQVMRGDRDSRRLLLAIAELPPCPKHLIPHNSPRRRPA